MLQNIRDHITGWVAGIVIVLIAIAFVFWGLEYYLNQSTGGKATIAKVNGQEISEKEFNQVFQNLQREQIEKSGGASLDDQTRKALKQFTLQQMINQAALLNAAHDAGFNASDDQIKQIIVSDPEFQVNGRFSPQKFQQLLYANALSTEQFFDRMRQMLMVSQLSSGLQNSAFVLPNEVKHAFLLLKEERDFGYFIIRTKPFIASVSVSQKEIKEYYQEHLDKFKAPEKVKVSYLSLSPEAISKKIKVSDQTIKQYYESNIANYSVPKRWKISQILVPVAQNASKKTVEEAKEKIDHIVSKISRGASFSEAIKNDANQKTRSYWINSQQISGSMVGVLNNLKLNEVSAPFRTEQGFVVVKLDQMRASETKTFNEVKDQIKKLLNHQQAQQIFSNKSDQLSNLTYTNPNTLSIAAKALDLKIKTSSLITRQGEKKGILSNPKILSVVFSDDVLQGNNSQPIELKDGTLVVVRVDKRIPSKEKPLSSVKNKIKNILTQKKAERKAGLKAYQVQTALNKGQSPSAVAKKFKLRWISKSDVDRNDKTVDQTILKKAFNLSLNKAGPANVASIQLSDGDYIVLKLLNVTQPDFDDVTSSEQATLKANLTKFYGEIDYHTFVNSVVKHAKVKIYKNSE